jgi:hypothetical protein
LEPEPIAEEPKVRIAAQAPAEEILKYESVVKQQIPIIFSIACECVVSSESHLVV